MWNSLRSKLKKNITAKSQAGVSNALRKLAGGPQFQQHEFARFVRGVQEAGIELLSIDAFVARYNQYHDAPQQRGGREDAHFGHFKFDIHGDIARPVEMARILNETKAHGLFLAMHRHALNESWYGSTTMWDALKEIRDLGHEIGLHADPFHLINMHKDLYAGLEAVLEDFRKQGFAMRTMTLHGDTRPHIKARKLQANDFFADGFRQSKWDGIPPEGQEMLAEHVGQYKHRKLYRKLGIEYVADVNLVEHGKLVTRGPMMYLSDNQRRLRIGNIASKIVPRGEVVQTAELFSIPAEFIPEATKVLVRRPFLALFHPQWYQ